MILKTKKGKYKKIRSHESVRKSEMRIGIDIDDTLTDIREELDKAAILYAKKIGKLTDEKIKIGGAYGNGNIYQQIFHFSEDELKYFLKEIQESVTENALPRKNVVEVIHKLKELGHTIIIITARADEFHDDPYRQSKEWLERNNIVYDKLVVNARDKGIACIKEEIDLYIDDNLNHCMRVNALGIQTIRIGKEDEKKSFKNTFCDWNRIYEYILTERIVKIVEYREEQKEEIDIFINKCMYECLGRPYKQRPDLLNITDYYIHSNGNFWCAIDVVTKKIIGTIAVENKGDKGILKRLYVENTYQERGIATRLCHILEQYVKKHTEINTIYLCCGKVLKKAHQFYTRKGFKKLTSSVANIYVADEDDLFMKTIDRS